ncbi:MAG TPA: CAP domain-containing protein [Gaiellaceae bacterium]|nr:CAP domain-containing protein [Gaiellaceae bacterium]
MPRWLGRPGLVVALLVVLAAPFAVSAAAAPAQARPGFAAAAFDRGILGQLNAVRVLHGLAPLAPNAELDDSAAAHSSEMGAVGYFEHRSADGTTFWQRIERWYGDAGYGFWSVGENLLWSSPDVTPAQALAMWMRSPEHRANILAPRWREVGIAAVHLDSAPGLFRGLPVTIVTTDFGVRR